jgi:hypothetical protein
MSVSPTLGFPLKLLAGAFEDATKCRAGKPTREAWAAFRWLMDDVFEPASFVWCCHWLSLQPNDVRQNGLARAKGGWWRATGRARGGVPEIFQRELERLARQGPK